MASHPFGNNMQSGREAQGYQDRNAKTPLAPEVATELWIDNRTVVLSEGTD